LTSTEFVAACGVQEFKHRSQRGAGAVSSDINMPMSKVLTRTASSYADSAHLLLHPRDALRTR
jgi:hypothetical protein